MTCIQAALKSCLFSPLPWPLLLLPQTEPLAPLCWATMQACPSPLLHRPSPCTPNPHHWILLKGQSTESPHTLLSSCPASSPQTKHSLGWRGEAESTQESRAQASPMQLWPQAFCRANLSLHSVLSLSPHSPPCRPPLNAISQGSWQGHAVLPRTVNLPVCDPLQSPEFLGACGHSHSAAARTGSRVGGPQSPRAPQVLRL